MVFRRNHPGFGLSVMGRLQFFNANGQLRKTIVPESDRFTNSKNDIEPGLYVYTLIRDGVQTVTGKLVVR